MNLLKKINKWLGTKHYEFRTNRFYLYFYFDGGILTTTLVDWNSIRSYRWHFIFYTIKNPNFTVTEITKAQHMSNITNYEKCTIFDKPVSKFSPKFTQYLYNLYNKSFKK